MGTTKAFTLAFPVKGVTRSATRYQTSKRAPIANAIAEIISFGHLFAGNPGGKQLVAHRQHHRPNEQAE